MGSLLQELKRRKVFRVAAVYAVVAWVLIEVTSTVLPTFNAPDWVNQTITLLFILGFPLVIVLAWAYEVSPEGVKPDSGIQSPQVISQSADQKLIYAILGLLLLLGGFQLADRFLLTSQSGNTRATLIANEYSTLSNQITRSSINLGSIAPGPIPVDTFFSISPDGTRLAYSTWENGDYQLYLRELNSFQSKAIGEPAQFIIGPPVSRFSPDSESLAYNTDLIVSVRGGFPQSVGEKRGEIFWESNETIAQYGPGQTALFRTNLVDGTMSSLLVTKEEEENHVHGRFLPDGKTLLVTKFKIESSGPGSQQVELLNLSTGATTLLIENAYDATYTRSGHIVFARPGQLWAVPFDVESLQLIGGQTVIIDDVGSSGVYVDGGYEISDGGRLVYLPNHGLARRLNSESSLNWVDRTGEATPISAESQVFSYPRISPNQRRFAVDVRDGQATDIWTYNLENEVLSRLTFTRNAKVPAWSSQGDRIAYLSSTGIWIVAANGSGEPSRIADTTGPTISLEFSPEDKQLLYSTFKLQTGIDVYTYDLQGDLAGGQAYDRQARPLLNQSYSEADPRVSPDGRWVAYTSLETGEYNIFVTSYPDSDSRGKFQISTDGGVGAAWSADGTELFYNNSRTAEGELEMYSVSVELEGDFSYDRPELLFTGTYIGGDSYDVSSDGQRFLMLKPVTDGRRDGEAIDVSLVLVDNWFDELRRLAPPYEN